MLDLGGRPFDPLEEDAAAENQHPGDAARQIVALGRLDDAVDLGVVDTVGGTAAVDVMIKRGQRGSVQLSATWNAVFVEHGRARSVYARQAVPPGA